MQDQNELLKYFIEQTNKRFDDVDQKLEHLISFNKMLLGGAFVISGGVSLIIAIFFHY